MLKLKDRVKAHIHEMTQLREMEKLVSDLLQENTKGRPIYKLDRITLNTYPNSAHLYIYFSSTAEAAEMDLLPLFNAKWERKVLKNDIVYSTSIRQTGDRMIYITVFPQEKGTCKIIPKQTGKVRMERKTIDIEVPEIEYLVDCSDEGGDDN
jgi:hypothetical protein